MHARSFEIANCMKKYFANKKKTETKKKRQISTEFSGDKQDSRAFLVSLDTWDSCLGSMSLKDGLGMDPEKVLTK